MSGESLDGSAASRATSSSLLDRIRANDQSAWTRLVDLYGPLVYYWCRSAELRAEDAADLTQEVMTAVATNIQNFQRDRPGDTFRGWLRIITTNKIRDYFRRNEHAAQAAGGSAANQRLADLPADSTPSFDDARAPSETNLLVRRALELIRPEFTPQTWQAFWRVVIDDRTPRRARSPRRRSRRRSPFRRTNARGTRRP